MSATERELETTCAYCGVGCGVSARVNDHKILAVAGSASHPANLGALCVKGAALHETMGDHGRLLHPQVDGKQTDWPTAIETVATRLAETRRRYGPESIAFYLSGQLLTEDYYVANKLAKGFIGTGHVDTNSRLCMSSAVAAHKRAFGADAVPCNYEDLELADLLVLVGSNAAWTHPILYRRMAAARERNPNMRIVVLDPRRTATCDIADLHLPIAPGSDGFVFAGLLNWLDKHGAVDAKYIARHTKNFAKALAASSAFNLQRVAETAAVEPDALRKFYTWFAQTEKTVSFFSQGVNQSSSGTDKCNAIINCHLATGRIGKPGMGPFSITGQPNAMGGREVGGLSNQLAAHMEYTPEHRETVSEFWGTSALSKRAGLKAVDLFEAVLKGKIRAIWIMGTNPVVSMPDADRVRAALNKCDTVIVSDCIAETDTTACADILLPAMGWGEKSGTVTNSERRISRQRALVNAPGEARSDWWIMTQVAREMGFGSAFPYRSPRDVFAEHAALSGYRNDGQRLFDIRGLASISEEAYDALEPIQWPVVSPDSTGTARLFSDGKFATANGRAQFVAIQPTCPAGTLSKKFPLALNTGRIRDQWHTMTRTGRTTRLLSHIELPFVLIHPNTATSHEITEGDLVEVRTRLGSIRVIASLEETVGDKQLFVPIHWNDQFASQARVGSLIEAVTDPVSGQPEFKHTAASICKVSVSAWAALASRTPLEMSSFPFWSAVPLTHGQGFLYLSANTEDFDWAAWCAANDPNSDTSFSRQGKADGTDFRYLGKTDVRMELAVFSATTRGKLPGFDWLQALYTNTNSGLSFSAIAGPTAEEIAQGRKICSCFAVGEKQIIDAIIAGADSTEALGAQLKCGTNCGSCIPELKLLISQSEQAGAA